MNPGKQVLNGISAQRAQLGTIVADRYELVSLMAEGGMGAVYKARHVSLDKTIAVKVLKVSEVSTDAVERFTAEAKAAASLNHPNLMAVYDYGQLDDGSPYLVMEYVEGKPLSVHLKEGHRLKQSRAISMFKQICDGLAHAHERGVIHRDLKPANILIVPRQSDEELVKIVDFGLAKRMFEPQNLTRTGQVFGTPLYMSPEQCTGKSLDTRSDIYSMGVLMYEALTRKPPLQGETPVVTMFKHLTEPPCRINSLRYDEPISSALEATIMHCLEKAPADRFQSIIELRQSLAKCEESSERLAQQIADQYDDTISDTAVNLELEFATEQLTIPEQAIKPDTERLTIQIPTAAPTASSHKPQLKRALLVGGLLGALAFPIVGTIQHGGSSVVVPPPVAAAPPAVLPPKPVTPLTVKPRPHKAVAVAPSSEHMPPRAPNFAHAVHREPIVLAKPAKKPGLFKRFVHALKNW